MPRKPKQNTAADLGANPSATDRIFINNYPSTLCHERINGKSSISFSSISFKFHDAWASFILLNSFISESTKSNGTLINNCKNLFLGKPDEIRLVSVPRGDGMYDAIKLSNQEILNTIESNRVSYKAAHA